MEVAELRNQTLVAAAVAKADGFHSTHAALIEIVRELLRNDQLGAGSSIFWDQRAEAMKPSMI